MIDVTDFIPPGTIPRSDQLASLLSAANCVLLERLPHPELWAPVEERLECLRANPCASEYDLLVLIVHGHACHTAAAALRANGQPAGRLGEMGQLFIEMALTTCANLAAASVGTPAGNMH